MKATRPVAREPEALAARDYERVKPEVLRTVGAKLAARGVRLSQSDLDAVYNEAWHVLLMKMRDGERVENLVGLLVTIAYRRALNEHRDQRPARRVDGEELDAVAAEYDIDAQLDAEDWLRELEQGLRERFDPRERQAAALCYLYDYTRPEAARVVGVTPKRMEKIMDGVSKQVAELLGEIRAGKRCSNRASLIRAYALGLLDEGGERHRLAREHLDGCSACRRQVLVWRGMAAVAPPAPLLLELVGAGGAAAGAGAAGLDGGHAAGSAARGARRLLQPTRNTAIAAGAGTVAAVAVAAALAVSVGGGEPQQGGAAAGPPGAADTPSRSSGTGAGDGRPRDGKRRRTTSAPSQPAAAPPQEEAQPRVGAEAGPEVPAAPAPEAAPEPPPPAPAPQQPASTPPPEAPVRDGAEEFELR